MGEGYVATYFVQIINQLRQIIVLKALYARLILFPVMDVAELIVELG